MGSWDPTIYGFAPIQYVGSNFSAGTLSASEECVEGYDSASFVMGTSSSLFNQFALQYSGANLPSIVNDFIQGLLNDFAASDDDIASWVNPFCTRRTLDLSRAVLTRCRHVQPVNESASFDTAAHAGRWRRER